MKNKYKLFNLIPNRDILKNNSNIRNFDVSEFADLLSSELKRNSKAVSSDLDPIVDIYSPSIEEILEIDNIDTLTSFKLDKDIIGVAIIHGDSIRFWEENNYSLYKISSLINFLDFKESILICHDKPIPKECDLCDRTGHCKDIKHFVRSKFPEREIDLHCLFINDILNDLNPEKALIQWFRNFIQKTSLIKEYKTYATNYKSQVNE